MKVTRVSVYYLLWRVLRGGSLCSSSLSNPDPWLDGSGPVPSDSSARGGFAKCQKDLPDLLELLVGLVCIGSVTRLILEWHEGGDQLGEEFLELAIPCFVDR